jgi:3'-5' exoribonuclease
MIEVIPIKKMEYGQSITTFLMIKNTDLKKAKNDSLYLDMVLGDTEGVEASAKLWNADPQMVAYKSGEVVLVDALVQKFNGKLQLRINKLRKIKEEDQVSLEDFIESAPRDSEEMFSYLEAAIENFENHDIKKITKYLLNQKRDKLTYYPAAKTHHHAIKSGLLYHMETMLNIAQKIAPVYEFINKDLLYAGVILHDLSKVDEMESTELGIVDDYTKEGKLLGHIIQGIKEIDQASLELEIDEEVKLLLEHMILAHHYHPEYGSPKKPLIPEAELLHYIDLIDSRMYAMNKVLKDAEKGSFADKSMTLEGRHMYKSDL